MYSVLYRAIFLNKVESTLHVCLEYVQTVIALLFLKCLVRLTDSLNRRAFPLHDLNDVIINTSMFASAGIHQPAHS